MIWLILMELMMCACEYRPSCGRGTRNRLGRQPLPSLRVFRLYSSSDRQLHSSAASARLEAGRAGSWGSHKQGNVACGELRFCTRHRLYACFVEQIRLTASTPLHCLETFLATHAIVTYNSHLTRTYIINLIKALYIYELERTFWQVFTCPLWP